MFEKSQHIPSWNHVYEGEPFKSSFKLTHIVCSCGWKSDNISSINRIDHNKAHKEHVFSISPELSKDQEKQVLELKDLLKRI